MNDRVTIRRARAADYPHITRLLTEANLPLDGLTGHDNFVVLSREGRVVGCAAVERYANCGLLRSVALDSSERRHGLGRRLVQQALREAREQGIAEIILFTTTAAPFFERLDFQTISRSRVPEPVRASVEFQTACPQNATVMHLKF